MSASAHRDGGPRGNARRGGIDFIKDDELQSDGPLCPFEARVDAVMRVVKAEADRRGRQAMIAFNITGDLDQMSAATTTCSRPVGLVSWQA